MIETSETTGTEQNTQMTVTKTDKPRPDFQTPHAPIRPYVYRAPVDPNAPSSGYDRRVTGQTGDRRH